jgi:hypothetical protein
MEKQKKNKKPIEYGYLPSEWAEKHRLISQRRLLLESQLDQSPLFQAYLNEIQQIQKIELNVSSFNPENLKVSKSTCERFLLDQYFTAFLYGYDTIVFSHEQKMPLAIRNSIRQFTNRLFGFKIEYEDKSKIVAKETYHGLDLGKIFELILSKIGLLIQNFIEIVEHGDLSQTTNLIEQAELINNYFYLIKRSINFINIEKKFSSISTHLRIKTFQYHEFAFRMKSIAKNIQNMAIFYRHMPINRKEVFLNFMKKLAPLHEVVIDSLKTTSPVVFFGQLDALENVLSDLTHILMDVNVDILYFVYLKEVFYEYYLLREGGFLKLSSSHQEAGGDSPFIIKNGIFSPASVLSDSLIEEVKKC